MADKNKNAKSKDDTKHDTVEANDGSTVETHKRKVSSRRRPRGGRRTHGRRKKKGFTKISITRGKRKSAIAIAVIKDGPYKYVVNGRSVDSVQNDCIKQIMLEPLSFVDDISSISISVNVKGGGALGQAQAVRTAVAKGLVEYFKSESIREAMEKYDRSLIIEDDRRVETKKYHGRKARARRQKSYR